MRKKGINHLDICFKMLVVLSLSCLVCLQKIQLFGCVSAKSLVKDFWKMLSVGEDLGADLVFQQHCCRDGSRVLGYP